MRNLHVGCLGKDELQAITEGKLDHPIDDMECFETLAAKGCLVMPPWIYHVGKDGKLEKVTAVRYTADYALDKASILLAVMQRLPQMAT